MNEQQDIDQIIDACCDRYESAWRGGNSPELAEYLNQVELPHRPRLLRELLFLEPELVGPEQFAANARRYREQLPEFDDVIAQCLADQEAADESQSLSQRRRSSESFSSKPTNTPEAAAALNSRDSASSGSSKWMGNYKLLQVIGEGGMGSVWMAEQEKPVRRRVALKIIKAGLDSREVIARFEAERQALAMMDHPNIARILDAGTTEQGRPYFAMELVHGIPFNKYCDQNKLSINERLELFIPVCQAVQHAHQKGVIHRDLKPSNVLVSLYDGKPVPKVIDFGLAKALEHTTHLTDKTLYTEFGQVVGTLQYMSPEQAELNQLDIDTRTDIYALGVMLYELLTGGTPLDQETLKKQAILKVLETIREQDPPRPSVRLSSSGQEAVAGISQQRRIEASKLKIILRGELDWVVMKALEKDRTRRYETANGLAEELRHYLEGDPVEARPPSAAYRMRKFVRKNRTLVTVASTFIVFLVVGATGASWFAIIFHLQKTAIQKQKTIADNALADSESIRSQIQTFLLRHPGDPEVQQVLDHWREYQEFQILQNKDLDTRSRSNARNYEDLARLAMRTDADGNKTQASFELCLDYLMQANEIRQALIRQLPDDTFLKRELADNFQQLANLHASQGNHEQATAFVLRELNVYEQDPQTFSADIEATIDRALIFTHDSADRDTLLDRKVAEIRKDSDPVAKQRVLRRVALEYANRSGKISADPLADMKKAHELFEQLAREFPSHPQTGPDLAWSHGMLGDRSLEFDLIAETIDHYQQEIRLLEAKGMKRMTPDELRQISDAQVRLADLLMDQQEFRRAADLFERDFEYWQYASRTNPTAENRKNTAFARGKQAGVAQRQGQFDLACTLYEDAIRRLTELQESNLLDKRDSEAQDTYADQLRVCRQRMVRSQDDPDFDF